MGFKKISAKKMELGIKKLPKNRIFTSLRPHTPRMRYWMGKKDKNRAGKIQRIWSRAGFGRSDDGSWGHLVGATRFLVAIQNGGAKCP